MLHLVIKNSSETIENPQKISEENSQEWQNLCNDFFYHFILLNVQYENTLCGLNETSRICSLAP